MIAKLWCRLFGHKRGRRVHQESPYDGTTYCFACPRCKATWTRKVKAKA